MNQPPKTFNAPNTQELEQLVKFCTVLSSAPYYKAMGPGGVLAIYLTAREMGLPLMTCLNGGLYTFDGKVTMSANLMNMMIINAGHLAKVIKNDAQSCEILFIRSDRKNKDESEFRYSYTIEEAKTAGYLGKDVWRKHPKAMLFARCLSGGARIHLPDVIMGAYVIGELGDDPKEFSPGMPEVDTISCQSQTDTISYQEPAALPPPEKNHPDFENFCATYLQEGSLKAEYLKEVCEIGNCALGKVINAACENPERFHTGYQKWQESKGTK
jgi:hypothetical protein